MDRYYICCEKIKSIYTLSKEIHLQGTCLLKMNNRIMTVILDNEMNCRCRYSLMLTLQAIYLIRDQLSTISYLLAVIKCCGEVRINV